MAIINLNLSHEEFILFNNFAKMKKTTIEKLLKKTLFEKIEDEYDAMIAKEALFEFSVNPYTLTVKEIQEKYNL
ncbi:MAG: DUF6290 family protein [Veillonella sp.]|uniref:type II toxin-antitoxin system RelB family antitoxin n=1 Tax=Veillonella sp. TaxID=1926307 RepID=UPI0028FE97D4|nr:DUF6290 family protein [Veillonella sp.]MDU2068820.1 DUF6290 family protein [Veillonella sp.]MDU3281711.1 DUF6290 family protein [Veillonella sp.]